MTDNFAVGLNSNQKDILNNLSREDSAKFNRFALCYPQAT